MKINTIETEEETGEKNITLLRADDLHPLYKEIRDSKQRVISTTEYTDNSIQFNNPNRDIHKKITLSGEFYEATSLDSILSAYPFENDGIISLILIYVNDDMVPFDYYPMDFQNKGRERITVPAGDFDCYKLEATFGGIKDADNLHRDYYFLSVDESHIFVKHQDWQGNMSELVEFK